MALKVPEWLARHEGRLEAGVDGKTYFVLMDDGPQYRLLPVPVDGKFGCAVTQTINGKSHGNAGVYLSPEEALQGGLETLRQALGW